jgi:hypothetical protein
LPEAATKAADSALGTYPGAPVLLDLQAVCRDRLDLARDAMAQTMRLRAHVDELIAAEKFQEATDYVLGLHGGDGDQSDISTLLTRILKARKDAETQAALREQMSQADQAANGGRWEAALEVIDGAIARFPAETELRDYRRSLNDRWQKALRAQAVEALLAEVRALEISASLEAARERLAKLGETLGWDPAMVQELERMDLALGARAIPDQPPLETAVRLGVPETVVVEPPLAVPKPPPMTRLESARRTVRRLRGAQAIVTAAVLLVAGAAIIWRFTFAGRRPASPVARSIVSSPAPIASSPLTVPVTPELIAPPVPVTPAPAAPPRIQSFYPDRSSTRPGQSVSLRWAVAGSVTELWLTPGGQVPTGATSQQVTPTTTTTYTLTAKNASAAVVARAQLEVIPFVPPSITRLRAEPENINPGQTARLVWDIAGEVSRLDLSPGVAISLLSRSAEVSPQTTTIYRLQASGPAGSASESVIVQVARQLEAPPPLPPVTADLPPLNPPVNVSLPPPTVHPLVTANQPPGADDEAQRVFREAERQVISKNYGRAAALFGQASKLNQSWKDPLVQKAMMDAKLGLFESVIVDCDEALRLDSSDAVAHNFRGFALYSLNRNREAVSEFSEAIRLRPDYADAYLNRGNVKVALHDDQNANADFAMARSLQNPRKKR